MRGFLALLVGVLVAIGVGIGVVAGTGGSSEAGAQRFAERALSSLGSGRYLQLVVTESSTSGASKGIPQTISDLTLGIDLSDSASSTLSTARLGDLGLNLYLASGDHHLVDLRLVDGKRVYLRADPGAIAKLPGLSAKDRAEIDLAAPLGNRWFQLPPKLVASLLKGLQSQSPQPRPSSAESRALAQQLEAAVNDNGTISVSSTSNGEQDVHASVELQPFLRQVTSSALPLIEKSTSELPRLGVPSLPANAFSSVQGTFAADLYADAASAELHRVVIDYSGPNADVAVKITASHQVVPVGAPAGSTLLPQTVIDAVRQAINFPSLS